MIQLRCSRLGNGPGTGAQKLEPKQSVIKLPVMITAQDQNVGLSVHLRQHGRVVKLADRLEMAILNMLVVSTHLTSTRTMRVYAACVRPHKSMRPRRMLATKRKRRAYVSDRLHRPSVAAFDTAWRTQPPLLADRCAAGIALTLRPTLLRLPVCDNGGTSTRTEPRIGCHAAASGGTRLRAGSHRIHSTHMQSEP